MAPHLKTSGNNWTSFMFAFAVFLIAAVYASSLPALLLNTAFSYINFVLDNLRLLLGFFSFPKTVSALQILLACFLAPMIAGIAVHTTNKSIQLSNLERFLPSIPVVGAITKHVIAPMFVDKQLLRLTTSLAPIIFVFFISVKPAHSSWSASQTLLQSWTGFLVHTTAGLMLGIDLRVRLIIAPQPGQRMWETILAISQLMITGIYYTSFGLASYGVDFAAAAVYLMSWYPLTMALFGLVMSSFVTGMLMILEIMWAWCFPTPEGQMTMKLDAPVPGSPRDWFLYCGSIYQQTLSWILEAGLSMLLAAYAAGCGEHFAYIAVENACKTKSLWWPTRLTCTVEPGTLLRSGNSWLFWRSGWPVAVFLNILCVTLLCITVLRVIRVTHAVLLMAEFRRIRWQRPEVANATEFRKVRVFFFFYRTFCACFFSMRNHCNFIVFCAVERPGSNYRSL
jgi:hypothetical protein